MASSVVRTRERLENLRTSQKALIVAIFASVKPVAKRSSSFSRLRKRVGRLLAPQVPHDSTRVSSFPFLSGDTFRLMAGTEFVEDGVQRFSGRPERLAFVKADLAAQLSFADLYREWASSFGGELPILIVHNSDASIGGNSLRSLAASSRAVYCVNVTEEFDNVYAIPIGLENASLNMNGRLKLYIDGFNPDPSVRTRRVLSSFHEQTNPAVRPHARQVFEKSRFGYDGFQWKLGEYREELRRTKFVMCPPGNGHDTHRTWEGIYLGAVPVVLKGHLASTLIESNPIHAVDSYEEFVAMSDEDLDELYLEVRAREPRSAYAPYWVQRIMGSL